MMYCLKINEREKIKKNKMQKLHSKYKKIIKYLINKFT